MNEQSGFILLAVLLLLSFITELLLIDQQQEFMLKHLELNQYNKIQREQVVEVALHKLSQTLFTENHLPNCLINKKPINWFSEKNQQWWSSAKRCHKNVLGQKVNYLLMPLFKSLCVVFQGKPVQFVLLVVNSNYRISITRSVILAIFDPANRLLDCQHGIETITHLQQAWISIKS